MRVGLEGIKGHRVIVEAKNACVNEEDYCSSDAQLLQVFL